MDKFFIFFTNKCCNPILNFRHAIRQPHLFINITEPGGLNGLYSYLDGCLISINADQITFYLVAPLQGSVLDILNFFPAVFPYYSLNQG